MLIVVSFTLKISEAFESLNLPSSKALISSCEKASRWDMAMQMLEEMCT